MFFISIQGSTWIRMKILFYKIIRIPWIKFIKVPRNIKVEGLICQGVLVVKMTLYRLLLRTNLNLFEQFHILNQKLLGFW